MRYQIQRVSFNEYKRNSFSNSPSFNTVYESFDHDCVMRVWNSYYSGLNDATGADPDNYYWGEPHCNQNYGKATFYRIIACSDNEELSEPTYKTNED